jgi:IS30 family transposase
MCKYKQITDEQRIQIEILLKKQASKTEIAQLLGIHRATLYRELKRNAMKRGGYNARSAGQLAEERKERFRRHRGFTDKVKRFVVEKLNQEWSPEQIAGYCKANGIEMVSHETIYQFVYADKRAGGMLYKKLRIAAKPYRKRYGKRDCRGQIPGRISIDDRPPEVQQKLRYGDWEADTIIGKNHQGAILTLVERKSYFTLLRKLERTESRATKHQMINALAPFKENVLTITSDNGHEFYEHQEIARKLQADYYFTHPYSAWEKGINENTNGLLRQYLPKNANLKEIQPEQLAIIEHRLNTRPRKSLKWKTPLYVFMANFANTSDVALVT